MLIEPIVNNLVAKSLIFRFCSPAVLISKMIFLVGIRILDQSHLLFQPPHQGQLRRRLLQQVRLRRSQRCQEGYASRPELLDAQGLPWNPSHLLHQQQH